VRPGAAGDGRVRRRLQTMITRRYGVPCALNDSARAAPRPEYSLGFPN